MIVDKIGAYRTRAGEIVIVKDLYNTDTVVYQIFGIKPNKEDGYWTKRGDYLNSLDDSALDLIEYLQIEEYPELYI